MARRGGIETAIGQWAQLMEGMQASPLDFYAAIEAAIKRREIPGCRLSRVEWPEGGFFSARRQYLRAKRGEALIDVCGAPFGTAFFSSSWLCIPPPTIWKAIVLLLIGLYVGVDYSIQLAWLIQRNGLQQALQADVLWPTTLQFVVILFLDFLFMASVVIFGIIRPLFFPPRQTFYRYDTAEMFYRAVHEAVREVVDGLRSAQGLRALTEAEWKPIMKGLGR